MRRFAVEQLGDPVDDNAGEVLGVGVGDGGDGAGAGSPCRSGYTK